MFWDQAGFQSAREGLSCWFAVALMRVFFFVGRKESLESDRMFFAVDDTLGSESSCFGSSFVSVEVLASFGIAPCSADCPVCTVARSLQVMTCPSLANGFHGGVRRIGSIGDGWNFLSYLGCG